MDVNQMQVLASNTQANQASGEIKEAIKGLRESLQNANKATQAIDVTPKQ